ASGRRCLLPTTGGQRPPLQRTNRDRHAVALALLVTLAIPAAGLYGSPGADKQAASSQIKCTGTAAVQNPTANTPMTAAQGAEIIRELRAIRELLASGAASRTGARRPAAPRTVRMRVKPGWYGLGNSRARVTLVEFTDLECPFCRRFQTSTFAKIKKNYIDTGKVSFIARALPLPMHPYALTAAEAARCAGDQGAFWQFRDAILADQAPPAPDVVRKHASELRLNLDKFQACLSSGKYKSLVQSDHENATALGIHGTPGFVIGRTEGGWIDGISFVGARPSGRLNTASQTAPRHERNLACHSMPS
ncbi:MAG: DsbA family protein, partial [Terriglobia bacterium]